MRCCCLRWGAGFGESFAAKDSSSSWQSCAPHFAVGVAVPWQWGPLRTCAALSVFECSSLSKTSTSETSVASFSDGFSFQTTNCLKAPDPVLAMASHHVITVQPQFSAAPRVGEWQSGLLDCCSDFGVCEYTHTPCSWCWVTMCFWCFPRSFCGITPAANPIFVGTSGRAPLI